MRYPIIYLNYLNQKYGIWNYARDTVVLFVSVGCVEVGVMEKMDSIQQERRVMRRNVYWHVADKKPNKSADCLQH